MAHPYDGSDAPGAPVIPASPAANRGKWPSAVLPDDGDERDAMSAYAGIEAAHDKANFLAWRTINIVDGGSYSFTPAITLANPWTWNGSHTFRAGITLTNAGSLTNLRQSLFADKVTLNNNAPLVHEAGSYQTHPAHTPSTSTQTIATPWHYHHIKIPGSANATYTLAEPSSPLEEEVWLLVSRDGGTGATDIVKTASSGTALFTWHPNQNQPASVLLRIPSGGTAWQVVHYNGIKRSWFVTGGNPNPTDINWSFF